MNAPSPARHAHLVLLAAFSLLLMVCIRNAWDLVTYLAPRKDGGEEP